MNRKQLKKLNNGGSFEVSRGRGKVLASFPYGNFPGGVYGTRERAESELKTYLSKRQVSYLVSIYEKKQ